MNEEVKQVIRVARSAVIKPYLAGSNGRFHWPYRLQPAHESIPSVRRKSLEYILDSGFDNDNEITNDDLLDLAERRDPEYIIPNDEIRGPDTTSEEAIETTAARVAEFLDMITERDLNATVLVPLQPPYGRHYRHLIEHYPRQARRRHFALGGLKPLSPEVQLCHIRQFRAAVGWDAYAHGFGLGAARTIIKALRDEPGLLDSADFSTVLQHGRTGQIAGRSRKPIHYGPAQGTDSATTIAKVAAGEMVDIARMLSPSLTDEDDIEPDWEKLPYDPPEGSPAASGSSQESGPTTDNPSNTHDTGVNSQSALTEF